VSAILIALTLSQAAPVAAAPPGILFGFYRVFAFKTRADQECRGWLDKPALDQAYDELRRKLIARWGEKPFSPKKPPRAGAGDCQVIMNVYRVNFAEYRKAAEAALASQSAEAPKD
jgi:hypothetical protein